MEYGLKEFFDQLALEHTGVYVVEKETMKVLYENERVRRAIGRDRVGELCYQVYGNVAMCSSCPLHSKDKKGNLIREEQDVVYHSHAVELQWEGRPAYGFFVRKQSEIAENKMFQEALFRRMNRALQSSLMLYCDINMETMRCHGIYFTDGRNNEYPDIAYTDILKIQAEKYILKEDVEAALAVLGPENLKRISADSREPSEFSVRYRASKGNQPISIYESRGYVLRDEYPHHICITTREVTDEENTKMQLMLYNEAKRKVHALFHFNVTHNRCEKTERAVFVNKKLEENAETITTIDACREAFLQYVVDEKHQKELQSFISRETLLQKYAAGEHEIKCQVPYRIREDIYEWYELQAVMMQNPVTGDIEALLSRERIENYITEKNLLSQVVQNDYDYIILIDLVHNRAHSYAGNERYHDFSTGNAQKYFDDYLKAVYVGEDTDEMIRRNQFSYIQKILEMQEKYEQFYFVSENAGEIRYKKGIYSYPKEDHRYLIYSRVDNTALLEQQRKIGEEVKEKQRLLKILNQVPCGITINEITEEGISAVYINDGFYKMLDACREERAQYQGKGALGSIHPEDVDRVTKLAEAFVAGEEHGTINYRILAGNGDSYLWVKLDAVVFSREPDKVTLYCSYSEVETLVETQLELQRNRLLLSASMESAKVTSWWLDINTHTATLSDLAQKKFHVGPVLENMPERSLELGIVAPESISDFINMYEKVYRGEKVTQEIRMHYKDSTEMVWERMIYTPMYDSNGQVTEAVGTSVDITNEKLQKQLEQAVINANQANKAKTDFLARMSHDMRTPMNAIMGLTALTLDQAEDSHTVRENLSKMRQASDFMMGLVNDILDMAKIEDGSVKLNMEPYRYKDFVLNMKTMFKPQCDAKGIEITFAETEKDLYSLTDKLRLNQIFFNIFSNAVKYTPPGGEIHYFLQNLQKEGNWISCDYVIQDTGIGMSEEFQKNLFMPFSQENNMVTPELQGSGLGLSITKRLVELMGGTIRIESKRGKGTTVTVHLSLETVEPKIEHKNIKKELTPDEWDHLANKKVLMAEDHPLNAEIARKLLETKHMVVTHAEDGQKVVDIFNASEQNTFDMILMDIRMPKMSGLDATRKIRALDRADAKTIPIIAMTANAYEEDVQKSLDAGMNAHLAKPINPKVLYDTIAKQIQNN